MNGEDDSDKQHEPTQRRLDEARKRGEIPRSLDLITAAGYGGLLIAGLVAGATGLAAVGQAGVVLLDQADRLAPLFFTAGAAPTGGVMLAFLQPILPLALLPMAAALLAIFAQRALIFAPDKLMPKLSRISPWATAKQKFGREGLFAFAKSTLKLLATCVILGLYLPSRGAEILYSLQMTPAQSTVSMLTMLRDFLALAILSLFGFGALDYLFQYFQHLRRNMMSRQEVMDEHKDAEGDPHVKAQRRRRAQEIALNQMLADVARADVVVVNPTHYAVALKWQRSDRSAPICLAKGTDEIAARIRERAAAAGVPLHRDPPTARALHATVEIGHPIRPEHYRAVAAAIRFAEAMRKKARAVRR
jgi:flagellar biosynthetic protein FlhB